MGVLAGAQARIRNSNTPQQLNRPAFRLFGRTLIVSAERLRDLPADTVDGVQMRSGILKNPGDFSPVDRAALLR